MDQPVLIGAVVFGVLFVLWLIWLACRNPNSRRRKSGGSGGGFIDGFFDFLGALWP